MQSISKYLILENLNRHIIMAISIAMAVIFCSLVGFLFVSWFQGDDATWSHLLQYTLPGSLQKTIQIWFGALAGASLIACLLFFCRELAIARNYRFVFDLFCLWPLMMPTYIMAYVWIFLLDYSGPVATWLRQNSIWNQSISIRSVYGCIFIFSICFYPYLYLMLRSFFQKSSKQAVEASLSLGASWMKTIRRIIIPQIVPWILAGWLLISFEVMSDFATAQMMSVDTLTVTIFKTWSSLQNPLVAAQLSSLLFVFALILVVFKNRFDHQKKIASQQNESWSLSYYLNIHASFKWLFLVSALIFFCISLLLPIGFLSHKAIKIFLENKYVYNIYSGFMGSLALSMMSALFIVCICFLFVIYGLLLSPSHWHKNLHKKTQTLLQMGYSIPGTVLGIAGFVVFYKVSPHFLASTAGVLLALVLIYFFKFHSVAYQSLYAQTLKWSPHLIEATESLGHSRWYKFYTVQGRLLLPLIPLIFLSVFLEVIKDVSIFLILRPYDMQTLSLQVFQLSQEGQWNAAALPALGIVLICILISICIAIFNFYLNQRKTLS